jgi:hypothetical protein
MFCNLSEEALAECSWRLTCCSKTCLFTKRSLENGMCVSLFSDICLHFSLSLSMSQKDRPERCFAHISLK